MNDRVLRQPYRSVVYTGRKGSERLLSSHMAIGVRNCPGLLGVNCGGQRIFEPYPFNH